MKTKPIRTMVVDDHPAFRIGLTSLIASQPDMLVAAETGNGREAEEWAAFHRHEQVRQQQQQAEGQNRNFQTHQGGVHQFEIAEVELSATGMTPARA